MLEDVKKVFETLDQCCIWSVKLLKIHTTSREGTTYLAREIILEPSTAVHEHVIDIKKKYTDGYNPIFSKYSDLRDYDGTAENNTIYRLNPEWKLIEENYARFSAAMMDCEQEGELLKDKYSAYIISGILNGKPIHLISMHNPFVNVKKKLILSDSKFKPVDKPMLSLRTSVDVMIFDDEIYMLSMAGENLFNLERAYKAVCEYSVTTIIDSGILSNIEIFRKIATSKSNPRRFISYNEKYLEKLKNKRIRGKIAKKFEIPLIDGNFDSETEEASERIVKVLCGKGMLDPFDANPMEVSGSRIWC